MSNNNRPRKKPIDDREDMLITATLEIEALARAWNEGKEWEDWLTISDTVKVLGLNRRVIRRAVWRSRHLALFQGYFRKAWKHKRRYLRFPITQRKIQWLPEEERRHVNLPNLLSHIAPDAPYITRVWNRKNT